MSSDKTRPARPADLDEILAIEAAWPTTPHWTRAHFEREIAGGVGAVFLVLEAECLVAAYGSLRDVAGEAQIVTVAVRPDRARRGLGRRLLRALLAAARARGCRKATLEVSAANPAAERLYLSEGFRVVGRRPKFYNDGSDALLMDLSL